MMIDNTELMLEKLGWDRFFRKHFQLLKVPGSLPARVVSEHRNSHQVCSQYGELSAKISGKMQHQAGSGPVAGARRHFDPIGQQFFHEPRRDGHRPRRPEAIPQ